MPDATRLPQGVIFGTDLTIASPIGTVKRDPDSGAFVVSTDDVTPTYAQLSDAAVADPGDAGAIPVAESAYLALVTAGAETRTLAVPTFLGQTIGLYFETDGGDCVLTVAAAYNVVGNTVVTFADAGDSVKFEAFLAAGAGTLAWRLVHNDGAGLS